MGAIASQITSLTIVYSIVYSDVDQRKHQSSASLAFVWGIHRGPVNSPHQWPFTRKMFPFGDVIMPERAASVWYWFSSQPDGQRPWTNKIYHLRRKRLNVMPELTMLVLHVNYAVFTCLPTVWRRHKRLSFTTNHRVISKLGQGSHGRVHFEAGRVDPGVRMFCWLVMVCQFS